MKKNTEKQPIDDLFARKLSNLSLPPSADGFDRLQTRMGQHKPEARMVVWRNPTVQRYMTAAACLVLLCSLGWLYWPSASKTASGESQVAVNQNGPVRSKSPVEERPSNASDTPKPDVEATVPFNQAIDQEKLAKVNEGSVDANHKVRVSNQPVNEKKVVTQSEMPVRNESALAQAQPIERKTKLEPVEVITPNNVVPVGQSTSEQVAVVDPKPAVKSNLPTERVLVVTIEEPAALVAARQTAKAAMDEKASVATTDKPEKEVKEGGLWKQVKRFKQGELFARGDNANNDDRGLLSRAYDGLKHSLDKDKSAKQ